MDLSHQLPIVQPGHNEASDDSAIDPVCGMSVDKATAKHKLHARRHDVLLLLPVVPEQIRGRSGAVSERRRCARHEHSHGHQKRSAGHAGTYTCPMHPEVRQQGPGSCPKCGMALEPESPHMAGGARRIHVPDASGDRARWAGQLSEVRHGVGAANCRAAEEENPELADMSRRFWVSAGVYGAAVCDGDGVDGFRQCTRGFGPRACVC